jgi:hypothetical protein
MTDKELSARIDRYMKEVFNHNCPVCGFKEGGNHQNIKVCPDCQKLILLSMPDAVEIELISQICYN